MDDEQTLLERCRNGDQTAFDSLVRTHTDRIRRIVGRYVKSEQDTEDVTQAAFVRAYQNLTRFRGESAFGTWLCRIAINTALNFVRGTRADDTVPLEDDTAFTITLDTSRLVAAELWRKVLSSLEKLPPKQRLVVELRVLHDLSFDEVAALADCSEDSAKANYHVAVKRLRAVLDGATRSKKSLGDDPPDSR